MSGMDGWKPLRDNEMTLRAYKDADTSTLTQASNGAWILAFKPTEDDGHPVLTDEWEREQLEDGRWVQIRSADCGSGCRCAGEFQWDDPDAPETGKTSVEVYGGIGGGVAFEDGRLVSISIDLSYLLDGDVGDDLTVHIDGELIGDETTYAQDTIIADVLGRQDQIPAYLELTVNADGSVTVEGRG